MDFNVARKLMVEKYVVGSGISDNAVIQAMLFVHRHLFVDEAFAAQAYGEHSLPIGAGQTISQPATVARMTEALQLTGAEKVLEIGTGSGYQAAILAQLVPRVYTVERIASLIDRAGSILRKLGIYNVIFRHDDGSIGWLKEAPFDRIIVTAEAPAVPNSLLHQLKPGGRMLIPIRAKGLKQGSLKCIDRIGDNYRETELGPCQFVKLVGKEAWQAIDRKTAI